MGDGLPERGVPYGAAELHARDAEADLGIGEYTQGGHAHCLTVGQRVVVGLELGPFAVRPGHDQPEEHSQLSFVSGQCD